MNRDTPMQRNSDTGPVNANAPRAASPLYRCIAAAAVAATLASCSKPPPPPPPPQAVPVTTALAQAQDVPITLRAVGTAESIAQVTLRPQVAAQILDAPSGEGVDVKAGDVIIRLDARPYEATLKETQAALSRHQTLAADAHKAAEAWRTALANKATSEREAQAAEAQAAAADAQVMQDQAAIDTAKLNLEYCTIKAPFPGRLGALMVKPGAIVKENETDLISITQIAPIDVGFAMPEQHLIAVRTANEAGPVPAQAAIPGVKDPSTGSLSFIDNKVDPMTGTVRLKARFDNADRRLWPGQFLNMSITIGVEKGVVVVPVSTVQASQKGQSVFVVKPDQTVEQRHVKARLLATTAVIESGVNAGETVVTDGQLRLIPGTKITVKEQKSEPRPTTSGSGNQSEIPNPQSATTEARSAGQGK
jgi:membrane fusion protein, multidrug efflux system